MADYNLGTARGKIEIDAGGVDAELAKANASTQKFKKGSDEAAASFVGTGKVIGGVGIALAAGLGFAVKSAADFEKRISAVGAVSGATGDQLVKVREKALQLGADTKYSASEAASAMEELVKAGLPIEDVLNGAADATVNLAAAGEVDLPRAAEIAANSMNQFNLAGKDMPKVADLIAGAANASAISVEDFGMSLSQVGAVANLAGFSFEDTATAIAVMGQAGIKGSDAGTSLKTMLGNLQPTTEKAAGALKDLGVITEDGSNKFYDAQGNVKSLAEISEILTDGTKDMSAAQKQMALETAFGSDAIRAAAVFANEGAAGIDKMNASMGKVTAADVAAKRMDNLSGSIEQLKGSFETALIVMGDIFIPVIRTVVDALTGLINGFTDLNPTVQKWVAYAMAGAAAILTFAGGFLLITGYVMKFIPVVKALGVALAANPWVLIVAGLIAVGAALVIAYKKFAWFRNAVDAVWDGVQELFGPLLDAVTGFVTNAVKQFKNLVKMFQGGEGDSQGFAEIMDNIFGNTGNLVGAFRILYDVVSTTFGWVRDNVVPVLQRAIELMGGWGNIAKVFGAVIATALTGFIPLLFYAYNRFEWLRDGIQTVVRTIIAVWDGLWAAMESVLNPFIGFLKGSVFPVFTAMGQLVVAVVQKIIATWNTMFPVFRVVAGLLMTVLVPAFQTAFNIIMAIIRFFVDTATAIWRAFGDNLLNLIQSTWQFIQGIVKAGLNVIKGIIQLFTALIKGDWGKAWDAIKTILSGVWDAIKATVKFGVSLVKNIINAALSAIRLLWDVAWSAVKNVLKVAWEAMKTTVRAGLDSVVSFIRGLPGRAVSALGNLLSTLSQKGRDLLAGFLEGARRGWDSLYNFLTTLPGKAISALGNLGSKLLQAGRDLIQGLIDGVNEKIDDLTGVLGKVTDLIPDWKGPPEKDAKLLYENGQLIMAGLINGIKSVVPKLEANLGAVTTGIPAAVGVPSGTGGGGGVTINLVFEGPVGAGAGDEIRQTINDPTLLGQIIRAAKSGSGGN
jgi:TP901 family phage tail tape measure protein